MFKQSSVEQANRVMSNKARIALSAAFIFVLIWSLSFRDARRAWAQTTTAGPDETLIIQSPTRSGTALAGGPAPETPQVALATFIVGNDSTAGPGSLAQAIIEANASAGTDDITFSNTFFNTPRTINLAGALPNITGSVNIVGPGAHLLTVRRSYAATADFTIFNIQTSGLNITISGMTISNGRDVGGAGQDGFGGGIDSLQSSLTLTNIHVTGNQATQGGGVALGLANGTFTNCTFSGNTANSRGGGIDFEGSGGLKLTLTNSTVSGNTSNGTGGGVVNITGAGISTLEVRNSTIASNTGAGGGGIRTEAASGTAATTLLSSIVANNTPNNFANGGGGTTTFTSQGFNLSDNWNTFTTVGTDITAPPLLGPLSLGGGQTPTHALLGGSPALDKGNSTGTDQRGLNRQFDITTINQASGGNHSDIGAVEMQAIIVTNANDAAADACDANCTLRDALTVANGNGAGQDDIILSNTVFNTAQAINLLTPLPDITSSLSINGPGANLLTVRRSDAAADFRIFTMPVEGLNVALSGLTVNNGRIPAGGGGGFRSGGGIRSDSNLTLTNVHVIGNHADSYGGGVYLVFANGVFTGCTISGNTAVLEGGAIYYQGDFGFALRLVNSTVSGNTANGGIGGVRHFAFNASDGTTLEVVNSTIASNAGTTSGGISTQALVAGSSALTTLRNTIIANNSPTNLATETSGGGVPTITSQGFNLSDNGNGFLSQTTDKTAPPLLGPLSLGGGQTPTHALLAGSPALDAGNRSGATSDQRGLVRPLDITTINPATGGDNSDIGAVEMQALTVTTAADPGDGVCDATCALRDAITAANANGTGQDDIIFSSTVGPTINLATALPDITSSVTMNGPGANLLTVRRNVAARFRIFTIPGGALNNAISGMTISNGNAPTGANGLGGGIDSRSNLTLTNVAVTGNRTDSFGGGVVLAANGEFTNSTFSGNTASSPTDIGGRGGAIYIGGPGKKLRLVNSTISGNTSVRGNASFIFANGFGGGIYHENFSGSSTLEIINSTVANNTAFADGGIGTQAPGGVANTTLRNCIIANNTPNNLATGGGAATITSQGFNLSDNGNGFLGQTTDVTATPLLAALADNGGPTQTHALLGGSPALDAGNNSGSGVTTDQRGLGFARPVDLIGVNNISDGTDIGAFEAQTAPAPTTLLQFSFASYDASETARTVQITVTRHGPTAGTSSVEYATSDGTATQVKDYTVAVGRLNFAAGETSKSFVVIITDDRFDDDSETFNVTLSNPVGAALVGTLSSAQVTIADNDSTNGESPVKAGSFDADFFVRQHYADFLNRVPDAGGLSFWVGQTTGCGNPDLLVCRINVSAAFFLSPEFQETGYYAIRARRVAFAKKSVEEATRVTFAQFIRDARQVGEGFVDGQPGSGAVLEANKQAFASQIVTSPEFIANFPTSQTAAEYVAALYAKAGVTPTATETQQAVDAFNTAGGSTAGRIAAFRRVTDSSSVRDAEFRGAFVLLQYFGYMRRDPDQPGYAFWLAKLNDFNGNFITAEMVKAFITSGEYEGRFGT